MWALHACFLAEEVIPTVSAPVLAQAWRGGPKQAALRPLDTARSVARKDTAGGEKVSVST
jgi:hypothetical protein